MTKVISQLVNTSQELKLNEVEVNWAALGLGHVT